MQITRHNHLRYLAKVTPFLIVLYVIQIFIYQQFAPAHLSGDLNLFLGFGLVIIILSFHFYDYHHQIIFRENYLEVSFPLLKMKEEILYRNITAIEITKKKHYFGDITLYLLDGSRCCLYHVDSPEFVVEMMQKKKVKKVL